ncbi:MAG: hypothetical protein VX938_02150, partial [Myxococcota bacterium]|nr:hypothetical protein [Myxococcota bacterium]
WSPPASPSTPPETLFPGLGDDREAAIPDPRPGALFCQEGEDCEPKNGEEACGEDCEPENGEEECGGDCGTDGGDPAKPHREPQKGPPEYETVSCDDGDEDCEHGEVHVDCDTSHETDDLDDL